MTDAGGRTTGETVTVAIPVLNGARYLGEVLGAVRAQEIDRSVELLIWDSGSTDGSLEIAAEHGARIHQIARDQFSHGGTRNQMAATASGSHIAFLTQDATPAGPHWLRSLMEGFAVADDVAAVFGPHIPRPDASHMIKCEMERHFSTWGNGGREIDIQRLARTPEGLAAYRSFPGRWSFLSDVNCCLRADVLARIPYREVPYAEDQLLGRELIEAGYAKVYHPGAAVIHSHDYPPLTFFRRYFDEFRSLREVLDHVEPFGPKKTLWTIRGLAGADKRWLRERGVTGRRLVRPLTVSVRHHTIRMAGAIAGARANRIPRPIRRALSLEGRDSFVPHEVPDSPLLDAPQTRRGRAVPAGATPNGVHVAPNPQWAWDFVRRAYPLGAMALDEHDGRSDGSMTLAFIVPPWRIGSGGHTTIFRLIRQLEQRGHNCAVYMFDPVQMERRPGHKLRAEVREHFIGIDAPFFYGLDDWIGADVAIATNWWSAWPLYSLPNCKEKAYLVQDDEPQFHATSAESIWAAETYRMGYRGIAFTPWMADILQRRHGMEARYFECGTDLPTYPFGTQERDAGVIAVYARRETERRAVDLAMAGIATLIERRPGVRPVLFGSNTQPNAPFPCIDLGVRPPRELARLYRRASAGIVLSLTTHSLVAQEMMASGLPLVELDGANVSSALGASGGRAILVEARPDAIADGLERILDHPEDAAAMARRARSFVEKLTWEHAGDQVEAALRYYLASPTRPRTREPAGV
jgi:glycosyltransferase involved in cell wall biosynthesis